MPYCRAGLCRCYPVSTTYGRPDNPRQPASDQPEAGGLLSSFSELDVSFQLEGEGLRSVLRWNWGEQE